MNTAAIATDEAIAQGSLGNLVELRIPELWDPISGNVMAEAGDQLKVWEITREYTRALCERLGPDARVKAVFPDAGAAAMLAARWPDAPFAIASANDRKLYDDADEVLVFAAPDPPSLESVMKASKIANENGAAVVLINPRLASGGRRPRVELSPDARELFRTDDGRVRAAAAAVVQRVYFQAVPRAVEAVPRGRGQTGEV